MRKVIMQLEAPAADPRLCSADDAEAVATSLAAWEAMASDVVVRRATAVEIDARPDGDLLPLVISFAMYHVGSDDANLHLFIAADLVRDFERHADGFVWNMSNRQGILARIPAPPEEKKPARRH